MSKKQQAVDHAAICSLIADMAADEAEKVPEAQSKQKVDSIGEYCPAGQLLQEPDPVLGCLKDAL